MESPANPPASQALQSSLGGTGWAQSVGGNAVGRSRTDATNGRECGGMQYTVTESGSNKIQQVLNEKRKESGSDKASWAAGD
jgi:hypothetical protein